MGLLRLAPIMTINNVYSPQRTGYWSRPLSSSLDTIIIMESKSLIRKCLVQYLNLPTPCTYYSANMQSATWNMHMHMHTQLPSRVGFMGRDFKWTPSEEAPPCVEEDVSHVSVYTCGTLSCKWFVGQTALLTK